MPTYEYICEACKHEFEQFQSITAPAIRKCPDCKKLKVRRKISSGAGILFKGGGFYETDYRSKGYADAAKKDADGSKSSSEGKSESKSETKSDGKSDAKAESKPTSSPAEKPVAKPTKSEDKSKKSKAD